jgi:predicted dehydrogenase/nucleoside-diphosphate-sugar epimerase
MILDPEVAPAPAREAVPPGSGRRPIAVALIGAGFIADSHLAVLSKLSGIEVVGICDPSSERANALCRKWKIPESARSFRELLEIRKPDVVHVLVPPPLHFEVVREALEADVHVFVEKPMALRAAECAELAVLARRRGLRLGVNHNWLHHPLYVRLRRDLAAYQLGAVHHVVSTHHLPLRQLLAGEHDHWMFQEPGNILLEQAIHPLSQICDLLGPVQRVNVLCSGEQRLRQGTLFPTRWQLALECAGGTAQIYLGFDRSFPESRVEVLGHDGAAHLDLLGNVYALDRRGKYFEPIDRLLRCLSVARRAAWSGIREFTRYGLSTLRLRGHSDTFYLGMCGSIGAFYEGLRQGKLEDPSAILGQQVIEGLEQTVRATPVFKSEAAVPATARQTSQTADVLVLGSTGFIGQRLTAALASAGHGLRLLVRRPTRLDLPGGSMPQLYQGDIRHPEDVRRAVEGCRAVIHLVSSAPERWPDFERLFVEGTRHVAEACLEAGVPKLLFVSSIAAYYLGRPGETVTEQTPLDPHPERRSFYSRAKIACEALLTDLHRTRGLPVTIFRPGVVVGAGGPVEHSGVGFWSGTTCVSWGRGIHRPLPFVLVDDVAEALLRALGRNGLEGKAFNLIGDVRLSAAEYIALLRAEARRDFRLHRQSLLKWQTIELAKWLVKVLARKPENRFPRWRDLASRSLAARFDCRLAKELLGWQPVADREEFIERGIGQALRGVS